MEALPAFSSYYREGCQMMVVLDTISANVFYFVFLLFYFNSSGGKKEREDV